MTNRGGGTFLTVTTRPLGQVFNIAPVSAAETENGGFAARGSYLSTGIENVGGTHSGWAKEADIFRSVPAALAVCLGRALKKVGKGEHAVSFFFRCLFVKTADLRPHNFDGKCLPRPPPQG